MFLGMYAIGFVVIVLSLVVWFYVRQKPHWTNILKNLVLLGILIYVASVIMSSGPVGIKLGNMTRDLLIIAGVGAVFYFLSQSAKSFVVGFIFLLAGLGWYYKNKLQYGFVDLRTPLAEQELLVEISEGASLNVLGDLQKKYNLRFQRAFRPADADATELDDYYLVDIPDDKRNLLPLIEKKLYASGIVDWVEENERIQLDDPRPTKQVSGINKKFGVNDPGLQNLWGFEAMEIDQLYKYLRDQKIQPRKKALVAILDTGVDASHEDIQANYKSSQKKYDNDPRGHGTHCAGIAGAVSNNGLGVASFAPDNGFIQLTSVKVLSAMGSGTQKMIIDGIIEAADRGADVISMSLGGRSSSSKQRAYEKAVAYANKKGAIVVAAAGNSSRNAKDYAPVNSKGVIGVSAIDDNLNRAVFSNSVEDIKYGLAAPGVGIYSTIPGSKYDTYNGTSMATPYVAGLLGVMKSLKPDLSTAEAHRILKSTGKNTKNTRETSKLIQPYGAVKALVEK